MRKAGLKLESLEQPIAPQAAMWSSKGKEGLLSFPQYIQSLGTENTVYSGALYSGSLSSGYLQHT